MKRILLFANESEFTKEIINFLIANRFYVHVFTLNPFKSKGSFICTSPLQLTVSIINVANYYNWKHDIIKYDVIINTLAYEDFSSTANQKSVFTNFTNSFADATKKTGINTIYLSPSTANKTVLDAENAMLKSNPDIFHGKYSFIVEHHSSFLHSILSAKVLLVSKKTLETKIHITPVNDIQEYILSIIKNEYFAKKTVVGGEAFTLKDIIQISNKSLPKKIIKLPHAILILISFCIKLLPKNFCPKYLETKEITRMFSPVSTLSDYQRYQNYTLLSSIIEKHGYNIYQPHID